jgi:hypothetical protein
VLCPSPDLNRDDFPDLVTTNDRPGWSPCSQSLGTGASGQGGLHQTGRVVVTSATWRDGAPELAFELAPTVSVLRNRRQHHAAKRPATGRSPFSLGISDLNGDGRPDLIALNADEYGALRHRHLVLLNSGDSNFEQALLSGHVTNDSGSLRGRWRQDLNGAQTRPHGHQHLLSASRNDVSVVINGPGPAWRLAGMTLAAANCGAPPRQRRTGRPRYSKRIKRGRVIRPKQARHGPLAGEGRSCHQRGAVAS